MYCFLLIIDEIWFMDVWRVAGTHTQSDANRRLLWNIRLHFLTVTPNLGYIPIPYLQEFGNCNFDMKQLSGTTLLESLTEQTLSKSIS